MGEICGAIKMVFGVEPWEFLLIMVGVFSMGVLITEYPLNMKKGTKTGKVGK